MVWGKRTDMIVHTSQPYDAEPPPAALAGRPRTGADTFYVRNHGPVPEASPDHIVRVDGLVDRDLDLRPDALADDFEFDELDVTLQCAGNRRADLLTAGDLPGEEPWGPGATSTARWSGVRLADVLAAAGVRDAATHVAFTGADVAPDADPPQTFGASIPLAKALSPEVLLATHLDRKPLPPVHGAPVRVVVPGWIGARSVKWLTRIEVRNAPSDNWFQAVVYRMLPRGADPVADAAEGIPLGPIPLNCAILAPEADERPPAGTYDVRGYAVAGGERTVARVDVSADGGATWTTAELEGEADPWTWRLWRAQLDLPAGDVEIVARAWDDTAATQPADPADVWNPKGYANTSWPRVRVRVE